MDQTTAKSIIRLAQDGRVSVDPAKVQEAYQTLNLVRPVEAIKTPDPMVRPNQMGVNPVISGDTELTSNLSDASGGGLNKPEPVSQTPVASSQERSIEGLGAEEKPMSDEGKERAQWNFIKSHSNAAGGIYIKPEERKEFEAKYGSVLPENTHDEKGNQISLTPNVEKKQEAPTYSEPTQPSASGSTQPTLPTGLMNAANQYHQFYTGIPGTEASPKTNLSPEEQSKLDKIDAAIASGALNKETGQRLKDQIGINSATPGTPGYFDQASNLLKEGTELEQKKAGETYDEILRQDAAIVAKDQENEQLRAQRLLNAKTALQDLNVKAKELANYHEDPDRMWNNKGTGSKLLAGIGLIFSGFGGVRGAESAMGVINGAIDRDIAAQRSDYGAKQNSYKAQQSVYGQMMSLYGDMDAAEAASKVAMIEGAQRKLGIISAKYQSPELQKKAQDAQLQLDKMKADEQKNFAYEMYRLQNTGAGGANTTLPHEVTKEVAENLKSAEGYEHSAQTIEGLGAQGDINLNPSKIAKGVHAIAPWNSDLDVAEKTYGKNGAAIMREVLNTVQQHPMVGEHSDADRDVAIRAIIGEGEPLKIAQRLRYRAEQLKTQTQRSATSMSPKQATTAAGRMKPAEQSAPPLEAPGSRVR